MIDVNPSRDVRRIGRLATAAVVAYLLAHTMLLVWVSAAFHGLEGVSLTPDAVWWLAGIVYNPAIWATSTTGEQAIIALTYLLAFGAVAPFVWSTGEEVETPTAGEVGR